MVVKAKDGSLVRLGDIATVDLGAQSTDSSVTLNGERAVFIGIQATPTGNPLNIVRDVRAADAAASSATLPPAVTMKIAYDSTNFINSVDQRGRVDAGRGGADRHRRHLPVPRHVALGR